jgi:hypothetical protein
MFRALMAVQWKWTKGAALLATILSFAIPLASVQGFSPEATSAGYVVGVMQGYGVAYALLAGGVGLAFAVLAWSSDHKGRHVYALSLPIDRSWYAAMRFGAGVSYLVLPALGVLAGSLLALAIASYPVGLHGYPVSLALRFFLASTVSFSIFFAIAASTPKAAGITLGLIALLFVVAFVLSAVNVEYDLLSHAADLLFSEPGPLSVFTGRWMLIDA